MDEPTYQYVKGQGWVLTTGTVAVMRCGKRIRVECRPPNPGEHYDCGGGDTFRTNGKEDPELWAEHMKSMHYNSLIVAGRADAKWGIVAVAVPID